MSIKFSGFEWDDGNAEKNLRKHHVTCAEAEEVFFRNPLIYPDTQHSTTLEARHVLFGATARDKKLFIAFTQRHEKVRIISARPMSHKERRWYEEEIQKTFD